QAIGGQLLDHLLEIRAHLERVASVLAHEGVVGGLSGRCRNEKRPDPRADGVEGERPPGIEVEHDGCVINCTRNDIIWNDESDSIENESHPYSYRTMGSGTIHIRGAVEMLLRPMFIVTR